MSEQKRFNDAEAGLGWGGGTLQDHLVMREATGELKHSPDEGEKKFDTMALA